MLGSDSGWRKVCPSYQLCQLLLYPFLAKYLCATYQQFVPVPSFFLIIIITRKNISPQLFLLVVELMAGTALRFGEFFLPAPQPSLGLVLRSLKIYEEPPGLCQEVSSFSCYILPPFMYHFLSPHIPKVVGICVDLLDLRQIPFFF